jgi:hypothetical protein
VSIEELRQVGTVWKQEGEEIRVAIKDAGTGPRVDARIYATDEGSPTRHVKRGGRWVEVPAYCGPTKAGLWLTVDQAAKLGTFLLEAAEAAESIEAEPAVTEWGCPDCGRENDGPARQCHGCGARRSFDLLASGIERVSSTPLGRRGREW